MKKRMMIAMAALLVCGALAALAYEMYKCPIDNNPLIDTGKIRYEYNKTLKEYKCSYGHYYWIVVQ